MTEELSITEVAWGDHRVRMVNLGGTPYIPLSQIARATEYRKENFLREIRKSPAEFEGYISYVQMGTGKSQPTTCINLPGTIYLINRVSVNSVSSEETRKKLIAFGQWVALRAAGGITHLALPAPKEPDKKRPDFDHILAELAFVKKLAKETGWDLNELRIAALRDHGLYSLAMVGEKAKPIEPPLALPAPAPAKKEKGYLTATDIGEKIGKTGQEVNTWLYQHNPPFIIKGEGDEWRLTELGKEYAYEHKYCPPNTFILRNKIEWKPSILEKMNIKVTA